MSLIKYMFRSAFQLPIHFYEATMSYVLLNNVVSTVVVPQMITKMFADDNEPQRVLAENDSKVTQLNPQQTDFVVRRCCSSLTSTAR